MKESIKGSIFRLPKPIRDAVRDSIFFLMATYDLLLGPKDSLVPPKRMIAPFRHDEFRKIGDEFVKYFIEFCDLKPNERVLDVGCGVGRMAIPLTRYLDKNGIYEGFDIISKQIRWCKQKISSKYPNFYFQFADIYNGDYNPNGKYIASEYKFPYENESSDFVFAISVFTHMLPQDMENYFSEIARVLKKGSRCFITYFLLNSESLRLIEAKLSTQDFKYAFENYRTIDVDTPERAVAYDEKFIRNLYDKHNLTIKWPVHYGSWCTRKSFVSYQDFIIATKQSSSV